MGGRLLCEFDTLIFSYWYYCLSVIILKKNSNLKKPRRISSTLRSPRHCQSPHWLSLSDLCVTGQLWYGISCFSHVTTKMSFKTAPKNEFLINVQKVSCLRLSIILIQLVVHLSFENSSHLCKKKHLISSLCTITLQLNLLLKHSCFISNNLSLFYSYVPLFSLEIRKPTHKPYNTPFFNFYRLIKNFFF